MVHIQMAMILLKSKSDINETKLVEQIANDWGSGLEISEFERTSQAFSFDWNKIQFIISEIPTPFPSKDLELPSKTAYHWKEAEAEVSSHSSHILIFTRGEVDPIEISKQLTRVTASVCKISDSIGVFWGASSQVIQDSLFIEQSNLLSSNKLPLMLWIKTTGHKNDDGTYYLHTIGLNLYGYMEFEIESYRKTYSEGFALLLELSSLVINNKSALKEGKIYIPLIQDKIKLKYKKSSLNPVEDVISIINSNS
ncbi:hypothetical protein [Candidatus Lokiarchaeum ossiferum]